MKASGKTLQLVVPGLLQAWPRTPASPKAPALARLLGRATRSAHSQGFAATLFALFEVAQSPAAAFTYLSDSGQPEHDRSWWLRADPVYLHADLHRVVLFDARALAISEAEAHALSGAFNRTFADAGLRLLVPVPDRWYLRFADDPGIRTRGLAQVIGRDINPALPEGERRQAWRTLLTEAQMLFHNHPLNAEREAQGRPLINSVWFWGEGRLPATVKAPSEAVYADDPLCRGLARYAALAVSPAPENARDWREAGVENSALIALTSAYFAAIDQDPQVWADALQRLERNWFAPLAQLLQNGGLSEVILYPCNGYAFHVTRRALRRFWRRKQPVAAFTP